MPPGLIKDEDIPRFNGLARSGPRFKPITLRFRLTDEEIANFAVQRPRFPGVDLQPRLVRHYPDGQIVAHAIGYVGALSPIRARPGSNISTKTCCMVTSVFARS